MSVLSAIVAAAYVEVEHASLRWRVRRVNSSMVSERSVQLLMLQIPTREDLLQERLLLELPEEQRAAEAQRQRLERIMERVSPESMGRHDDLDVRILCAGVEAVWDAEAGAWSPIRLVESGEPNEAATPPTLPVSMLPAGTERKLIDAIWAASTDGEAAAERVRNFRSGS